MGKVSKDHQTLLKPVRLTKRLVDPKPLIHSAGRGHGQVRPCFPWPFFYEGTCSALQVLTLLSIMSFKERLCGAELMKKTFHPFIINNCLVIFCIM